MLDTLFLLLVAILLGCFISTIIFVILDFYELKINSNRAILVAGLIFGFILFLFARHSDIRDEKLHNIIFNSSSIEELQEKAYPYFDN